MNKYLNIDNICWGIFGICVILAHIAMCYWFTTLSPEERDRIILIIWTNQV